MSHRSRRGVPCVQLTRAESKPGPRGGGSSLRSVFRSSAASAGLFFGQEDWGTEVNTADKKL